MDGSKQKEIAGETPATAKIPWYIKGAVWTLAAIAGTSLAYAAAQAPSQRELRLIEYGQKEGQQQQLHAEQVEDQRACNERTQKRSEEWNRLEAEQALIWEELFL